jgi:hypothetical protein
LCELQRLAITFSGGKIIKKISISYGIHLVQKEFAFAEMLSVTGTTTLAKKLKFQNFEKIINHEKIIIEG